jgi:hypothetical protein
MAEKEMLTRTALKTPRAAATAGIVFSILLLIIFPDYVLSSVSFSSL